MHPMRKLLYHRGVDDHIGTYVTDYVYSGVCFLLCIQLIVRICRQRKIMTSEQRMTSSCCKISNWLPWNWPKEKPTAIGISTYAVLLFGFSNFVMMLLGGLTHQFLQTVEPYNDDINNLWDWLIIWRVGSSFSAIVCFSLLIMTEQMITQERVFRIPHTIRVGYYIIIFATGVCFFGINYIPLTGKVKDPFSIRQTFTVTFGVVVLNGIAALIVVVYHSCHKTTRKTTRPYSTEYEGRYSPSHSLNSNSFCDDRSILGFLSCNGSTNSHRQVRDDKRKNRRRLELFAMTLAPWVFIVAGAANHFMKSTCADSDAAHIELGCPLPDSFNHNAIMHVMQIVSAISFFVAENMAITRRSQMNASNIKRVATSSTIYNDVINSSDIPDDKDRDVKNNNNNNRNDDVIQNVIKQPEVIIIPELEETERMKIPKFPTNLNYETLSTNNRHSLYDNLSNVQV
uniref:uncharacterized protein LOC120327053 n=1 Tax=Styela clava TaxID=7725 RepID=UPI00193A4E7A|nr:uncharacterized protein LOC120327053 [Styela clava]